MRGWVPLGVILTFCALAASCPAQEAPGGVAVDIKIPPPMRAPSNDSAQPPRFDPVGALSSTTRAAVIDLGAVTGENTNVSGTPAVPAEAVGAASGSAPAADGSSGGIVWTTLATVKPRPGNADVPPWWKLRRPEDEAPGRTRFAASSSATVVEKQKSDSGEGGFFQRIVEAANKVVGRRFDYAAGTQGGRLGCAQVVSTILKAAGAMKDVMLGVLAVISDLRGRGWKEVKPPPYQDGDVVTWATYDRSGDGRIDPDTHIGIISKEGNTVYAINNSSSQRKPVKVELGSFGARISRVLRKA